MKIMGNLNMHEIVHGPRADFRCRGVISAGEFSPSFFGSQDLKFEEKVGGGHLSAVAFGSERPLSENIYTF